MRSGPWKLHFEHEFNKPRPVGNGGRPGRMSLPKIDFSLFNLDSDPSETNNVASEYPELVGRMQLIADRARADLGDSATKRKGSGVRRRAE